MSEKTERCKVCDRAECPDLPFQGMDCDEFDRAAGIPGTEQYAAYLVKLNDCRAHRVDWRARALAAESSQRGRGEVDEAFVEKWADEMMMYPKPNGPWANRSRRDFIRALLADLTATARPAPSEAPRPLTVADALRDERVKRGEMVVQWMDPYRTEIDIAGGDPPDRGLHQARLTFETYENLPGGSWKIEVRRVPLRRWSSWSEVYGLNADVLFAPATLVPASEAP